MKSCCSQRLSRYFDQIERVDMPGVFGKIKTRQREQNISEHMWRGIEKKKLR